MCLLLAAEQEKKYLRFVFFNSSHENKKKLSTRQTRQHISVQMMIRATSEKIISVNKDHILNVNNSNPFLKSVVNRSITDFYIFLDDALNIPLSHIFKVFKVVK